MDLALNFVSIIVQDKDDGLQTVTHNRGNLLHRQHQTAVTNKENDAALVCYLRAI